MASHCCFGKISKSHPSHARHYKSLCLCVEHSILLHVTTCAMGCWSCSDTAASLSLSVTEKDLRNFLAGWAVHFLTGHHCCCSFKEEIRACWCDLSMGRCCNYSMPRVSGAAWPLSVLTLPPDVIPDPQQLNREENVEAML